MRWSVACIVLVWLCSAAVRPVDAQQSGDPKDPAIALGFAWLCPGCGHFYTGDTARGIAITTVSIGSIASGLAIQFTRSTTPRACSPSAAPCESIDGNTSLTPVPVGGAIGLAAYVYGLIDAEPSTRRMNARNELGHGDVNVAPVLASNGALGVQLSIRGFDIF